MICSSITHTYFAWSLLCEGTSDLWMSVNEWVQPHTSTTQDLSMRAHRYLAKVTSFYLRSDTGRPSVFTASYASSPRRHAKVNLLLYACLQSPIWNDILLHTPSYLDDRNSTTSTEGREDAMETRGRKADVTEAWKRRRKRSWTLQAGTTAHHGRYYRRRKADITEAWKRRRKKRRRSRANAPSSRSCTSAAPT